MKLPALETPLVEADLEPASQVAVMKLAVPGTDLRLAYRSDRVPGHRALSRLVVPLVGAKPRRGLRRVHLEVVHPDGKLTETFEPKPNLTHRLELDRVVANAVQPVPITVRVGHELRAPYPRDGLVRWREWHRRIGPWDAREAGLGGWTLHCHHRLDPGRELLLPGSGRPRRLPEAVAEALRTGGSSMASSDGSETFVFGEGGRHTATLDAMTGARGWTFDYDGSDHPVALRDGDGAETGLTRGADDRRIAVRAPGGEVTVLHLDGTGWLSRVELPDGEWVELEHDGTGLLRALTAPMGLRWAFDFDDEGRLIRRELPGGLAAALTRTEGDRWHEVRLVQGSGREWRYRSERIPGGWRSTTRCCGAGEVVFEAFDDGRSVQKLEDGTVLRLGPGEPGAWLEELSLPSGTARRRQVPLPQGEHDPADGRTRWTTVEGRWAEARLDEAGRLVAWEAEGLEPARVSHRDGALEVDWGGQRLRYGLDGAGRVASLDSGDGEILFQYDAAGRVAGAVGPNGRRLGVSHDPAGRLAEIGPSGRAAHRFGYGPHGQVARYETPGGAVYERLVGPDGEVVEVRLPSGRRIGLRRGESGRIVEASYPEATVRFSHDRAGRGLLGATWQPADGDAQELVWEHDGPLPLAVRWRGPASGGYRFRYDAGLTLAGRSTDEAPDEPFEHDRDGLVVRAGPFRLDRRGPGGAVTRMSDGVLEVEVSYDGRGRPVWRRHVIAGRPVYELRLAFDAVGRVASREETLPAATERRELTYDRRGQLVRVERDGWPLEAYAYDERSNRTLAETPTGAVQCTYDEDDRLVERGGQAYAYDADGFLVEGDGRRLAYSARGELLQASGAAGRARGVYDGLGRLVARRDPAGLVQFLYGDPRDAFLVTAVRLPTGALVPLWHTPEGFLVALDSPDGRLYVATDQVGTPRVLCYAWGEVVATFEHDAFGRPLSAAEAHPLLPFGFAGGILDPVSSLVRFGWRDYDPLTGRWTARDPLGLGGGDLNLYRYAGNDPVGRRDPTGLESGGSSPSPGSPLSRPGWWRCPKPHSPPRSSSDKPWTPLFDERGVDVGLGGVSARTDPGDYNPDKDNRWDPETQFDHEWKPKGGTGVIKLYF